MTIASPLDGSLFRFDIGRGTHGLMTTCNYLPLNMTSSSFDARDAGYRSKFALHVARKLLDDPAGLKQALKHVEVLDDIVEDFMTGPTSRLVSHLPVLDQQRNPDAVLFFLAHALKEQVAPPSEIYSATWIWGDNRLRGALNEYLRMSKGGAP